MEVLLFAFVGIVIGFRGLICLWQQKPAARSIALGVGALLLAGLIGFSAEFWFDWIGRGRGDGQVFIGYFMFGAIALLGAIALCVLAAATALFRRKNSTGHHVQNDVNA